MKNTFNKWSLIWLILLLLVSACNQKQFGHLSKVRVKQKDLVMAKQASKEQTEPKEEVMEEEQVEASAESETAITLGSNRNIIGKKQVPTVKEQRQQPKKAEANKSAKKEKKSKSDPNPYKPNIPAYIGLGLGVLSVLFTFLEFSVVQDGWAILIAFFLSIPVLILGIIGYSQYRREKATDGYMASLFAIIIGSIFLLLLILIMIFVLLIVLSGGYF
jgi:hypothetical protein